MRRVSRRKFLAGAASLSAAGVFASYIGCTPAAAPKPGVDTGKTGVRMGGTIDFACQGDPTSLDPQTGQGGGDHKYWWTMFDNLVAYNQQGIPDPSISLAESWDVSDPKKIVFKLRKGIKFHDGTPFDADVVKWNIERQQDPATNGAARAQLLPIKKMEISDPYSIAFYLDEPNAALLNILGDRGGAMISPEAVKKFGTQFGRNPVGTGPFKFVEWVQNDHVTVERNPDFWQKDKEGNSLPYVDKVILRVIPEPTVELASLESGELNLVDQVDPIEWDRIEKEGKLSYVDFNGAASVFVYFNESIPPFDNVDVRRAFAWSVDRENFTKALSQGRWPVATSFSTPAQFSFTKDIKNAQGFDLKKAQEYLDKSGLSQSGRKTMLQIGNTASYYAPGAELLQAAWRKLGFDVEVKIFGGGDATNKMWVERTSPLYFAGFSIRSDPDASLREVFHSAGFYNAGHKANPELDALIEKGVQTYSVEERKKIYREAEEIIAGDAHAVLLAYRVQRGASSKKVQGLNTLFGAEGKQRFKELWLSQ